MIPPHGPKQTEIVIYPPTKHTPAELEAAIRHHFHAGYGRRSCSQAIRPGEVRRIGGHLWTVCGSCKKLLRHRRVIGFGHICL